MRAWIRGMVVVIAVLLTACGSLATPAAPPRAATTVPTADWRRDWLRNTPCAPPCFQGILPGTTSQTATLELLRASPGAALANRRPAARPGFPASVAWLQSPTDRASGANAFYYEQSPRPGIPAQTIVGISIGGAGFAGLDEVLAVHGEPAQVLAFATPAGASSSGQGVALVYLDAGFLLQLDQAAVQDPNGITRDVAVTGALFFAPTIAGFDAAMAAFFPEYPPSAFLTPWEGFKPFAYYCRELGSGSPPPSCV